MVQYTTLQRKHQVVASCTYEYLQYGRVLRGFIDIVPLSITIICEETCRIWMCCDIYTYTLGDVWTPICTTVTEVEIFQFRYEAMNCADFWTRASERPFPTCSSRLHCPLLPASRVVDKESKGSPRDRTAADEIASDDGTWRSDSPTLNKWDPLQSKLTVFARHEAQNHDPNLVFEDPIGQPPCVEYRERLITGGSSVVCYAPNKSKTLRVKRTRRVHFSPIVSYESWEGNEETDHETVTVRVASDVSDHHGSDCLSHCGRVNKFSKLTTCSTGPVTPLTQRCRPSNTNNAENSSSSNDSLRELQIQSFVCNLSIRPNPKFLDQLAEPPAAADESKSNAGLHPPQSASHTPQLFNIERQANGLDNARNLGEFPLSSESPTTARSAKKDRIQDRGKWEISVKREPGCQRSQRDISLADIHIRTSLRNCSNLLQELGQNHPSKTSTIIHENLGDPSRRVRISAVQAIDKVGGLFEGVANLPGSSTGYDLGNDLSWFDAQGVINASQVNHKQHKEHQLTDLYKPSKSSYWFDVPFSTDADLPGYLLQRRRAAQNSEPVVDEGSTRSRLRLSGGNKASKSSYWFDVPYSRDAELAAYFLQHTSATPNSEPVVDVGSTRRKLGLSGGNKASKISYWFDAHSTDADLQRKAVLPDSEPVVDLDSARSRSGLSGGNKASKSSYWFDVPYSTDAELPAYLLQKGFATPNSKRMVDVVSTRRSLGVSGGADTVETVKLRKDTSVSPQALDEKQEGRQVATVFAKPLAPKPYPGEFCPGFTLRPGDIMMTRNLRKEQNKIDGHVTLFPDTRYFEEKGIAAADSSGYYQFTRFDMVLRFGQFDNHNDWKWVPSPSFSLFMYVPLDEPQSASWWLVDSKPSVAPVQNLNAEADLMPLNSRLQLVPSSTDLVISTIPDPGLACKKRWTAQWGSALFLPLTQDVLVRACYHGNYSSDSNSTTKTTWATVDLYCYCGDSVATWRFLGRDTRCYGPPCRTS